MRGSFNYELENEALARQAKLAEIMHAQGLQVPTHTDQVGGVAIQRSPMEGIAKVLQAYMGRKNIETVDDKRRALGDRYNADLRTGIDQLITGMSTQPGTQPAVQGNNQSAYVPPQEMDAAGANQAKRDAILKAIGSGHPVMQQLGMSYLTSMQKDTLTAKDLLPHAAPSAIPGMVKHGTAGFKAKKEIKEIGGVAYDPDTLEVVKLGEAYDPKKVITINGDTYQVNPSTNKLEKMDNAPKVHVGVSPTTVMNHGQKKLSEAWAASAVKTVEEMSAKARAANEMLGLLNEMEQLTQAGTHAGPMADAASFMAGLAQQAGIKVDANKLANSQTFASEGTRAWAALMQSMGGARGLVKEESEKIASSLPSLLQTPQGRAQIMAVMRRAAQQQVADAALANQQLGEAMNSDDPTKFSFGLKGAQLPMTAPVTATPGGSAQSPGGVLTLEQYIQSRKGK
jgi:hypothetical protein